jgi:hypothetical protein
VIEDRKIVGHRKKKSEKQFDRVWRFGYKRFPASLKTAAQTSVQTGWVL